MILFGKCCLFVLAILGPSTVLAESVDQGPVWPLDLSTRYLTSNFMEFRGGRFHAGLDLKTQSREGFTVRAVEDGYISRVRCTPTAYGRVVYLRGASGKTYVFAHLARFNDDLRERVEHIQESNQTYRARMEFKPGEIPVKKGQVLGLSGQSGTGGPHLHFEVRDHSQRPINPLDHGFAVSDTLPPVIHRLRAWPVHESSRINGQGGEWILDPQKSGGLQGSLGVLNISGPVAFSARMVDASDIRGHKLEPWLIELTLDGDLVYQCRNERYSFDENALQRLEWTDAADWTEEGVPREHWLHRRQANTLKGREGGLWYLGNKGEGLSPGDHDLALKVVDFSGGEASMRLTLRVQQESIAPDYTPWQQQRMGFFGAEPAPHGLTPFFSYGDPENAGFQVLHLKPENQMPVLEDLELWVRPEKPSAEHFQAAGKQGLKVIGQGASYLTADWPIESSVPVMLPAATIPETAEPLSACGIYRFSSRKKWAFVTDITDTGSLDFHLGKPGLHMVCQDLEAPLFMVGDSLPDVLPGPVSRVEDVTFSKWKRTAITLSDLGSGLDTGSIISLLDDLPLIVEPDTPRDRLLVHWPDSMTAGAHVLHLEATDRAGNKNTATYHLLAKEGSP